MKNNNSQPTLYLNFEDKLVATNIPKIRLLKFLFSSMVDEACSTNPSFYKFSKKMKRNIVNSLIMAYLEVWLENDETNKVSIDSYYRNLRDMQSQSKDGFGDKYTAICREMYMGKDSVRSNFLIQNEYSEHNRFTYKKVPQELPYGNKYSLLELEEFYKATVEPLNIYRDIFKNKEPYKTTNRDKLSVSKNIAKQDIDEYERYLKHIRSLINKNNSGKATKNNKEFVVKCLFVWKHERTYRYRLTAMLAKYLHDERNVEKQKCIPDAIVAYYSRYRMPLGEGKTKCTSSYFIKSYDKIIAAGYSQKKNSEYRIKIEFIRACFDVCFLAFCQNFNSVNLLGPWTEYDFEDVARFMINDYGIEECLQMPDMGDGTNYPEIGKLFDIPDYIDAEQRKFFKEKLKRIEND